METIVGDCPFGAKCETPGKHEGKDVIVRCPLYTMVRGTDTNTGKEVDNWACAIAWLPTLLINTSNEARNTNIEINKFRNVLVTEGEKTRETLSLVPNPNMKVIENK